MLILALLAPDPSVKPSPTGLFLYIADGIVVLNVKIDRTVSVILQRVTVADSAARAIPRDARTGRRLVRQLPSISSSPHLVRRAWSMLGREDSAMQLS